MFKKILLFVLYLPSLFGSFTLATVFGTGSFPSINCLPLTRYRYATARNSLETLQLFQATGAVAFSDSNTAQHARSRLPICCIRAVSMRCNNCMRHSPNGIC